MRPIEQPAVSPDGTQVAFVGRNSASEIWAMTGLFPDTNPAPARWLQDSAFVMEINFTGIPVSPDGWHIAFDDGGSRTGIWLLENFLPKPAK